MCLSEIQEDAALIQFYLQAIRKEIRDLLHLISSFSATLADLVEHAAQIDQNMKNSRFFDRPNWPPPRTTIWANLTNEQCQDYFKQGKCFNCGLRGHLAWACPTRKKGKAPAQTVQVAELDNEEDNKGTAGLTVNKVAISALETKDVGKDTSSANFC